MRRLAIFLIELLGAVMLAEPTPPEMEIAPVQQEVSVYQTVDIPEVLPKERNFMISSGPGYDYIEQTINDEVVKLTEEIGEIYCVAPELIQSLIYYESSNQRKVVSKYGDIGYMQVNPTWQSDRMDKLGVTNLYDGYNNILVGTDYLAKLCNDYEDVAVALMAYNLGPDDAEELAEAGVISDYAKKILDLSYKLERLHGK